MADTRKQVLAEQFNNLPKTGFLPGTPFLNDAIAPKVPSGAPRPLSPGEYVKNPDGSWSSEISMTVANPKLNGGKPTNVPSLFIVGGRPYRARDEDEAAALASQSGLSWPTFSDLTTADKAAADREALWQTMPPEKASSLPPLWSTK